MKLNDYQSKAVTTAVYPKDKALPYLALGLSGEAAEVANKVKKILRGDYDNDPEKAEEALTQYIYGTWRYSLVYRCPCLRVGY